MNKYMDRAKTMREQLNTLIKDFNDETAIANKELYPDWNGNSIPVVRGELLYYNKNLYRKLMLDDCLKFLNIRRNASCAVSCASSWLTTSRRMCQ